MVVRFVQVSNFQHIMRNNKLKIKGFIVWQGQGQNLHNNLSTRNVENGVGGEGVVRLVVQKIIGGK